MESSHALPPPAFPASGVVPVASRDAGGAVLPRPFGKYVLLRRLAQGGMAELYLALHRSVAGFEKLVVIKRILPAMDTDRAFIDMLLHEARIAATLSHPNIVQIFDVGEAEGSYFIAMEHVHGEDLRQIVRQMRESNVVHFPLEHAIAIAHGICSGLAYAHAKSDLDGAPLGIVHRDISPQNVIVTFSGDVKIVDFGIAKSRVANEITRSGKLKGKVPYMSPEQAQGEDVDARSDIFSTGVMLFELTTGKRLFKRANEFETLKAICEAEYPKPSDTVPGYPEGLERIVVKAIAKDKEERYQTAEDMQADLEAFVRSERIGVSNIALHSFMQSLFAEKIAQTKEALLQGRQLAEVLDAARKSAPPPSSFEMEAAPRVDSMGHTASAAPVDAPPGTAATNQRARLSSMPASAFTLPEAPAFVPQRKRARPLMAVAAVVAIATLGFGATMGIRAAGRAIATGTVTGPARAALTVTTDPPGAHVWVDGDLRGETPLVLDGLPAHKPLSLRVTKEGRTAVERSVVLDGKGETLRVSLAPAKLDLDVLVTPESAHATTTIDGVPFEKSFTPTAGDEHALTVTAPGFVEQTIAFRGEPGDKKHVHVTLLPVGTPQEARAPGAAVDVARGNGPLGTAPAKPASSATVAVGTGKLNVAATGGWCEVAVDGVSRGATPVAGIELAAGPHTVTCTNEPGVAQSATITVPADGVARHKFSL